ncbi:(2Fe-2S) ferredoxin domain-containing protein [Telluribacter sp.]|jgi:(2Fe-2S) ferredoxin|uniref:(2Fe-2S) ferredoxin domain-containing protein n=1 Tax=Telluribacter sp. TaxID=1978767 RepID=UPI002E147C30|nr:(2Fe-2S) ferredoxin domain-containing protein [Telluribacter sp.]
MKYSKHVFVCTNQKDAPKKCCGREHGLALVDAFKTSMKERKLMPEMRAQGTACLDMCAFGPTVVVYPEGIFYGNVQLSDVEEIIESHLVNGVPVERLKLDV